SPRASDNPAPEPASSSPPTRSPSPQGRCRAPRRRLPARPGHRPRRSAPARALPPPACRGCEPRSPTVRTSGAVGQARSRRHDPRALRTCHSSLVSFGSRMPQRDTATKRFRSCFATRHYGPQCRCALGRHPVWSASSVSHPGRAQIEQGRAHAARRSLMMPVGLAYPLVAMFAVQVVASLANFAVPVLATEMSSDIGVAATYVGYYSALVYTATMIAGLIAGSFIAGQGAVRTAQLALLSAVAGLLVATLSTPLALGLAAVLIGACYGP